MSCTLQAPSPPYPPRRARRAGRIWRLICVVELALEVRRERRMLLGMSERELEDVGFNRADAYAEAHRGFWDVPIDRLRL
jgi:uncharacterized protein YjiS (DUF1127 family)